MGNGRKTTDNRQLSKDNRQPVKDNGQGLKDTVNGPVDCLFLYFLSLFLIVGEQHAAALQFVLFILYILAIPPSYDRCRGYRGNHTIFLSVRRNRRYNRSARYV